MDGSNIWWEGGCLFKRDQNRDEIPRRKDNDVDVSFYIKSHTHRSLGSNSGLTPVGVFSPLFWFVHRSPSRKIAAATAASAGKGEKGFIVYTPWEALSKKGGGASHRGRAVGRTGNTGGRTDGRTDGPDGHADWNGGGARTEIIVCPSGDLRWRSDAEVTSLKAGSP